MQVHQREALEDPRPVVGIMAHAYANPLINNSSIKPQQAAGLDNTDSSSGLFEGTAATASAALGGLSEETAASAAAAANDLVIDALLAAEADTIGPDVRFLSLPRGTAAIPQKNPHGGAWRGADGLRVVDSALPEGLVKRKWLHKHTRELPGSLVYLASVDVSATAEDWAETEDEIVADLRSVVASLAARQVKVLLVLVRAGAEAGHAGGREERDVADERALSLRRAAEIDARMVLMVGEPDLASRSNPPSVRRIAKAAKDLAVAHYASHISRLRRWEKVLVPTQRLYRPLLTRLYFKLGVLHEMQGLVDRSLLCYQEVSTLLCEMLPRDGDGSSPGGARRGSADRGMIGADFSFRSGADPMEQIRGVAEVVHLRLVRNHLQRNMSVEGAIRQLRKHVTAFGRPFHHASSPLSSAPGRMVTALARKGSSSASFSGGEGGGGETGDEPEGASGGGVGGKESGVVLYRHHAWLSRQYLVFGEMLGAHISQFSPPTPRGGPGGGLLGYTSPGYYFLGAALQAVRRRVTSDRLFKDMDEAKLRASLEGLEAEETLYLGESVRLVDRKDSERDLQQECRAFLDLAEAKADRAEVARSLLVKALEHCPVGVDVFRRRRVLILSHLGEESFVSGRYDEVLERLPPVWEAYLADGWLQLAAVTLRRVYESAWHTGKGRTAADTALRLASKSLRPWVSTDEAKLFLAQALPLVGALDTARSAGRGQGGQEDQGFVPSAPPEESSSKELEVTVDASRLLLRLSGKFSVMEASAGDEVSLGVALMSLLPLETRLESVELSFNHSALNCTIRDTRSTAAPSKSSRDHRAELTLPSGGLLKADVGICLPWEKALPFDEPLRLVGARVLMRSGGGGSGDAAGAAAAAGVALLVPAAPGFEIAREAGGEAWSRFPGFEAVKLVPPRSRAHVSIAKPSSVLLGLVTRLLVTVSAKPSPAASHVRKSGAATGGEGCCGKPPHPFRGGFLYVECEPAPVPPPIISPHSSPAAAGSGTADVDLQEQEQRAQQPPRPPPPAQPARPRPDRAFFWEPATPAEATAAAAAAAAAGVPGTRGSGDAVAADNGKVDFLPVVVGSDGQPADGIPLSRFSPTIWQEGAQEGGGERAGGEAGSAVERVTIPVWVRSETAGTVTIRARVVYSSEGTSPGWAGAGAGAAGVEGLAVTEWARAEVLCARPLAVSVDVVSVQGKEDSGISSGGVVDAVSASAVSSASTWLGHTVAVKFSMTNLQEKRLVVSRVEIMPPSPPAALSTSPLPPSAATAAEGAKLATGSAAVAIGGAGGSDAIDGTDGRLTQAHLPNGPVLYERKADPATGSGGYEATLLGMGDSYTCCFTAKGYYDRPAPLGKLRITWKPDRAAPVVGTKAGGGGSLPIESPLLDQVEEASAEVAAVAVGEAETEFPLPVLSARPRTLSARLKVPPHARVGVEFSMRWEISNFTGVYSSIRLTAEDGGEFVWSGKRFCMLQLAPLETVSVLYRLVPKVPGQVLLPKVSMVPVREKVNIIQDLAEGRPHIFVRP